MRLPSAVLALASVGALVSGCAISPDVIYPLGRTAALNASHVAAPGAPPEQAVRTAKSGEILFSQSTRSAEVLVLENAVAPETDINMGVAERSIEIVPGLKFYTGINVGSETALVACSFQRPVRIVPRLNPGNSGTAKFCFRMDDLPKDVKLTAIPPSASRTSSTFFVVSEDYSVASGPSGPYQRVMRWEPNLFTYKTVEPARFRPATDAERAEFAAFDVALRFKATKTGGELELVYISNGTPSPLDGEPLAFSASDDFPKTVKLRGAEIELLALTDGVLAYRVVSGFTTDDAFILDLAG